MNTCKAKIIDLLREIKYVCDKEDIRYFVSGELALHEYQEKECGDNFNNGTIAVFAEDVERLSEALGKIENRKVESLANNRKFPGFYLRYMDLGTTLLNYSESAFTYETNSFGIDIEIICGRLRNTFKRKVLSKLKKLWVTENRAYYVKPKLEKISFKRKVMSLIFRLIKHTPLMKMLFNAWIKEGSKRTHVSELATNRGHLIKYKTELFDEISKTKYLDEEFCVVDNLDKFTENYFKASEKAKPRQFDIYDFEVSWEQFSNVLNSNNIPIKKNQLEQQEYLDWRKTVYLPMHRKRLRYYNFMFCAEDRMLFYKEYNEDKKAQVIELFEQKKYAELEDVLSDYIAKINHYARYRIGFCFDSDIFEIALHVMLYEAANNTKRLSSFKRKCKRLFRIIRETNYRHFDSVANVFWGEREEKAILVERKKEILEVIQDEAREHYKKYRDNKNS